MNTIVIFTRLRFSRMHDHLLILLLASQFFNNFCLSLIFITWCFLPISYHWFILLYSIVFLNVPLNLILIGINCTGKRISTSRARTVERFDKINYLQNCCHVLFLVVFFPTPVPASFCSIRIVQILYLGLMCRSRYTY